MADRSAALTLPLSPVALTGQRRACSLREADGLEARSGSAQVTLGCVEVIARRQDHHGAVGVTPLPWPMRTSSKMRWVLPRACKRSLFLTVNCTFLFVIDYLPVFAGFHTVHDHGWPVFRTCHLKPFRKGVCPPSGSASCPVVSRP